MQNEEVDQILAGAENTLRQALGPPEAQQPPSPQQLQQFVREEVSRVMQGVPMQSALPGAPGRDGTSVTIEDVKPVLEELVAKIPKAKDGKPGKDGQDGKKLEVRTLVRTHENRASEVEYTQSGSGPSWVTRNVRARLEDTVHLLDNIPSIHHADIAAGANTTNWAAQIQEIEDYLTGLGSGGTMIVPRAGLVHAGQITKKFKVAWRGETSLNYIVGASSRAGFRLRLADNTNAPLLVNDRTVGDIGGTGIDGASARATYCSIENIAFDGNRTNNTSLNADIIRFEGAWSTTIRGCLFVNSRGFGIRALDCNLLHLAGSHGSSAPLFFESAADCLFTANQWGGSQSPIYPVLWFSGSGSIKNIISADNFWFNNANNSAIAQPTFTVDDTTDIVTLSSSDDWPHDTPVVLATTGSLPGALSGTTTYYWSNVTSSTGKLATSRANRAAGSFVDISAAAGSGTHTIGVGKNCGVFVNSGAARNVIGGRIDQNYGHGVLAENAPRNKVIASGIAENGLSNATAQSGVKVVSSIEFSVDGLIDGTVVGASNQTIGVEADSASTGLLITAQVINHSTADISTAYEEAVFLAPRDFGATTGSPVIGLAGGSRREVFLFDAAADEIIEGKVHFPPSWASYKAAVIYINAGAGSGDVVWAVTAFAGSVGANLNTADNVNFSATTSTAGAQDIVVSSTQSGGALVLTPGVPYSIRVKRVGTDVADTLANDAGFVGLRLTRGT